MSNSVLSTSSITFAEWANRWLVAYKEGKVSVRTYTESYKRTVENYLIPYFGERTLDSIKPIDIEQFFGLQVDKYYLTTIRKMKLCLDGIFDSAVDNDFCLKNPARNIKATSNLVSNEKQTYTQAETDEVIRLCSGHRHGIYVWILLELGLRCGELCGLRWRDIDFERNIITVSRQSKYDVKKASTLIL